MSGTRSKSTRMTGTRPSWNYNLPEKPKPNLPEKPKLNLPEKPKQHLYLVFDDWNSGYSIRKVSLSRRSGKGSEQSSDSGEDSEQSGLKPFPAFMRIQAMRGLPNMFTSAFGTKIMAMQTSRDVMAGIPTIDVQDLTISSEPPPNFPYYPVYIPVSDDRLYALDIGSFELLQKPEPSGVWMWKILSCPPFSLSAVSSYAVRPDGCILVSIDTVGTFILDTKEHVWKLCGRWVFPFTGHGHYDTSLDGFVGLPKDPEKLGYLCCCTMASTTTSQGLQYSYTKTKVYNRDLAEGQQHVSATLVHMRQGKFCLVECVCTDDTQTDQDDVPVVLLGPDSDDFIGGGPQGGRFMYRLKTFSLSYDTNRDLKLRHCKVRCYSLPHEARIGSIRQDPVAFWL